MNFARRLARSAAQPMGPHSSGDSCFTQPPVTRLWLVRAQARPLRTIRRSLQFLQKSAAKDETLRFPASERQALRATHPSLARRRSTPDRYEIVVAEKPSTRRQVKLIHALRLLAEGVSVNATATAVGYESMSAFMAVSNTFSARQPGSATGMKAP